MISNFLWVEMGHQKAKIRFARAGEEAAIHNAHMRSIREVCVKDHGEEIRGWGYRPLGDRWVEAIKRGEVWVVEGDGQVNGVGYLRVFEKDGVISGHLHALYLTPEVIGKGIGFELAQIMLSRAKQAGVQSITLESSITAKNFYERLGFAENGPMQKVEIGGYPATCFPMIMDLKNAAIENLTGAAQEVSERT